MSPPKSPLDDLRIERSAGQKPQPRLWLVVVAVVVLALIGAALWWHSRSGAVEVQTAVARGGASEGGERIVLNASGYVTARRAATVSSKVTGKVVEVLIEEGMKVKAGQIVARLDDTNVKAGLDVTLAQLESAKSALEETRAQLKQAELEYERIQELVRQHIASQSDLDRAEADAKSLQGRLLRQNRDVTVAARSVDL